MSAKNRSNGAQACPINIAKNDIDPWEHWQDGPLLRKDSYTARQLTYLTPESVSLENRKIFIGNFTNEWIETNAQDWHNDIQQRVDELETQDASGSCSHSDRGSVLTAMHLAEMELATAIAEETESALKSHSEHRERRLKSLRLRRSRFRNHKLSKVGADSNANTTNSSSKAPASSRSTVQETSSQKPKSESPASSIAEFYDCDESLPLENSDSRFSYLADSELERPERESTPATSLESCSINNKAKVPAVRVDAASDETTDLVEQGDEAPQPLSHRVEHSSKHRHNHRLNPLTRIRKPKAPKIKLYQGKFLVQERKARKGRTVESELKAPLATQLVTRWKEYAVLAQKTGDPARPLVLYFYDCQDSAKLTRKANRRWLKSLAFKVTLDPSYHVTLFSELDFSLALWRPKSHGQHHSDDLKPHELKMHHHSFGPFNFLLIHAQSLLDILHLAYLLTSATCGTPWTHGLDLVKVSMPSFDVNLQISYQGGNEGIEEELRQHRLQTRELISYKDLLSPIVSQSQIVHSMGQSIWKAVGNLPRRFAISPEDDTNKFAMACLFNGSDHRPLWLTRLAAASCSIPWILWFLRSCASISLAQPKPRSNEVASLKEPPALEGYCSNMFTSKIGAGATSYTKPTFSTKRDYSLYLFTADNYLMCTTSQKAKPPMLAANQDQIEKIVEPYPLDAQGRNVEWIRKSTCLHEIDYHDAIASAELQRRKALNQNARVLIDLIYLRSFQSNEKGDVEMRGICDHAFIFSFGSKEVADCWAKRLSQISLYWRGWQMARSTRRAAGSVSDFSISPMIQNRSIVYSGGLFMKQHRFASFKAYHVLLTTDYLSIFKIDQTKRPPALPANNLPSGSYMYRHYENISLRDTYVYTGQVAVHALLNDDNYIDPSDPGVRSLPRAYEDGRISQDSELDRCFVLWRVRKTKLPIFNSAGDGEYVVFLAQEKIERDKWATAIRYVQTESVKERKHTEGNDFLRATMYEDDLETEVNSCATNKKQK